MLKTYTEKFPNLILVGILILAFFLRFHNIGKHGLAGDEKYSLFVSQFVTYEGNNQKNSVRKPDNQYFTPKEFWSEKTTADFFDSIARVDTGNGALYTYTLHFWSKLVGLEDGNLRLLSLIFILLTISLIYVFVRIHFKSINLALLSAFLATISPFYINYSQVARNYAMQFFFALLATHIFLLVIRKTTEKKKGILKLFIYYGFSVLACELCHISTFPLFFIHGAFILIYHRNIQLIVSLCLSMLIPLIGVLLWLQSDGGKWLFEYVSHSTEVYNQMAQTNPDEYLSVATLPNILKQIRHVISCNFINLEGLYLKVLGAKNLLFVVLLSVIAFLSYNFIKKDILKTIIFIGLAIISGLILPIGKFQNIVLYFNLFILWYLLFNTKKEWIKKQNKNYVFLFLLIILPFIFLILFALKDGNTFRIIPRYVGYSYSFGIIAVALIIRYMKRLAGSLNQYFFIGYIIQFALIQQLINSVWLDNPPRYFMSFSEPRKENPYKQAANKIMANYAKGDTVIYCSNYSSDVKEGTDMPQFSVVDAQLVNFYLPKSAEYVQRVNPNEKDKIFIKKSKGDIIMVENFEGTRFRY